MLPSKSQYLDILNTLGFIDINDCNVIYERGVDDEITFEGYFIVKIKGKGQFTLKNGRIIDYLF